MYCTEVLTMSPEVIVWRYQCLLNLLYGDTNVSTNYPKCIARRFSGCFHNVLYGGVNVLKIYCKGVLTTSPECIVRRYNNSSA